MGESTLFRHDVTIYFEGGQVTLRRGERQVSGAAEMYRRVIGGEAAGVPAAEELLASLERAAMLSSVPTEALHEGSQPPTEGLPAEGLPAELGALRLFSALGRGSFGSVYAAFDAERGIECAVKLCEQVDAESILDLKNEVRTAWSLSHPNLVVPYTLRREGGRWFFAMELVRGQRLVDAFAEIPASERLPWLARVFGQIADALDFLHASGVLHLDLTPNNILVREDGSPAILDFGLARWHGTRPLGTRAVESGVAGTLSYIAPEVLLGRQPTAASDWYSLGIVLFRLLSGAMPFVEMGAMELTLRPLATPPKTLREREWIPRALAEACELLLERRPERRADGAKLRAALGDPRPPKRPEKAPDHRAPVFLGREELLAALTAEAQRVAAEGAALVRVSGAPGIGKTALLGRFAASSAALVLAGRSYEHEELPYKGIDGVIDALRGWLLHGADPALRDRLRPQVAALTRLFPSLRDLVDERGPAPAALEEPRLAASQAMKRILHEIAAVTPLLLILDDVHWADRDSARLLVEMLSPPQAPPIMVVCAHRIAEAAGDGAFLSELAELETRGASYHRVTLTVGPLDTGSLMALAAHHGARLGSDAAALAVAEAAGSPFLVEELARYLSAHEGAMPETIALREAIEARLVALLPTERELVELTAIAGRSLDESILAAVSSAQRAAVSRGLVTLRARNLLRGGSGADRVTVAIYHDRLREEVVALISPEARVKLHRRWIAALEPRAAPPHELHFHYKALGERRRASVLALAAAEQAEAALAFGRAAEWYEEALTEESEAPRALLLRRRAEALFKAGRTAAAGDVFVEAATADPPAERALLGRGAEAYLLAGRLEDGRRLLAPLLRAHDIPVTPSRARLLGSLLRQLVSLRVSKVSGRTATAVSEADAEIIDACWSLGKAMIFIEPLPSMNFVLRSLHGALTAGDPRRSARALAFLAGGVFAQVRLLRPRAQAYLEEARSIGRRLDEPVLCAVTEVWGGMIAIGEGRWEGALSQIEGALAALAGHAGTDWERMTAGGLVVWLRLQLGEVRAATDLAAQMLAEANDRGDLYGQVTFLQYVAWAQVLHGNTAEARRLARWIARTWSPGSFTVQSFYVMIIEVLCDLYDDNLTAAAARWQAEQASFHKALGERAPQSRIDNAVLEARVLLRGPARAPSRQRLIALQRAMAREDRSDARAHAGWLAAALLASRGDREGAASSFAAAAATYAGLGLAHWANSALLQAHHLDPRRFSPEPARGYLIAQGAADPARWVETFMPSGATPVNSSTVTPK